MDTEDVSTEIETTETEGTEPTETTGEPADTETPAESEGGDEGAEGEGEQAETEEDGEGAADVEGEGEGQNTFKPNVKFKVLDKEMEIPKEFQSLMKDPESEKKVRELFEKAHGLDVVKTKLTETRQQRDQVVQQHQALQAQIGKARSVYQNAIKSGNLHRMDDFFRMLSIPVDHIMAYAIEKAKLAEMDPEQRQLIESRLQAEREREAAAEEAAGYQYETNNRDLELKRLQLEVGLGRPETQNMAQELESKFGRPGLFREEVIAAGEAAWFNERKNISVDEAIKRVAAKFGLTGKQAPAAQSKPAGGGTPNPGAKKVIQRSTTTIPNVNGAGGASPLKTTKPKSIEDIKKLRDRALAGEQV